MLNKIKTLAEIDAMRTSGKMLEAVLKTVIRSTEIGMSTKDLADIAAAELKVLGGKPAFLGYYGFPDVLCVSINEQVIHGIPSRQKILQDGDIVSVDFGVIYKGMYTDSARSFVVGNTKSADKLLIEKTEQALLAGVSVVKNTANIGDIGFAIEQILNRAGLGIVRDYVGHGVGHELHEDPNVPNYGRRGTGPILKTGMTIAIEPMATLGGDAVFVENDGWTVSAVDGVRAAHFEDTILVTADGYEFMTRSD